MATLHKSRPEGPGSTVDGLAPTVIDLPENHWFRFTDAPPEFEVYDWRLRVIVNPEPMPELATDCGQEVSEMTEVDWERHYLACQGAEVVHELSRQHRDDAPDPIEVWC